MGEYLYTSVIIFLAGIIIGALATFVIMRLWIKAQNDTTERMQGQFSTISLDLLGKVSAQLSQANSHVQARSSEDLERVRTAMENVSRLVVELEKDRVSKFGELSSALRATHDDHLRLSELTRQLHSVIYEKQSRGQWGERMAEDILRLAGFQEGINYNKQQTLAMSGRPDYTFALPKGHTVNMDVKFPLENYSAYVNEQDEQRRQLCMRQFINDVKGHIKTLSKREYISVQENTLEYVVMFIPSDLIYTTIFQEAPEVLDDALKMRVIICSPTTLYAVLSIIRQAVDNFAFERSTKQILMLMQEFSSEWDKFTEKMESLGKKIEGAQRDFGDLTGVRKNKLDRTLQQFQAIKNQEDPDA